MRYDKIYKPEVFQGSGRKKNYFEGWYFKCVDRNKEFLIAIIPGIAYEDEKAHSFIQICLPHKGVTYFFDYPQEAFDYREDYLYVQIGKSVFTDKYIYLDLENDTMKIKGLIWLSRFVPIPIRKFSPGIMGPFGLLPFLECYHGIVSMNHGIKGFIEVNGESIQLDGGKGYIEKDWGISFPEAYMWMQCNHFKRQDLSFMFSVAQIPLQVLRFRGFLCVLSVKNRVRVFATYTGAKILHLHIGQDRTELIIVQGREKIVVKASVPQGHLLKAPVKGAMKREIYETLYGEIELKIYYKNKLRIDETSKFLSYEMSGDIYLLQA